MFIISEELRPWGIAFGQNHTTKYSNQRDLIPRFKEIPYRDPLEVYSRLCSNFDYSYLLESIEGPKKLAEFSFIGFDPSKIVSVKNGKSTIREEEGTSVTDTADPLGTIEETIKGGGTAHSRFRLVGGAVGYVSYDAARYWEKLSNGPVDDLNLPDVEMGIYDDGIVFDHSEKKAHYYSLTRDRFDEVEDLLDGPTSTPDDFGFGEPRLNVSKEDFEESVEKTKQYIFNGDIFQAVLSKRYEFNFDGSLVSFYKVLREINPSPYMYFLKHGEKQLHRSSNRRQTRCRRSARPVIAGCRVDGGLGGRRDCPSVLVGSELE